MPIEIEWLVPERLCILRIPEVVNKDDVLAYDHELVQCLDAASSKVHLIADLRVLQRLPGVRHLVSLRYPYHPNLGHNLTVGLSSNPIVRFVITTGTQLVRIHHKDFPTVEAARHYLLEMEGL